MDQTLKYLEMCSKLPSEIKNLVPKDHQGCMGGDKSFFGYHEKLNGMVWLPRQDQLQDMLDLNGASFPLQEIERRFHKHCNNNEDCDGNYMLQAVYCLNSMEQLWLAFVMHEKYGLNWSSERKEWIQ